MPNFYAKMVIENGSYCISSMVDPILGPLLRYFGACKSMQDFGLRSDNEGRPLVEDCQKILLSFTTPHQNPWHFLEHFGIMTLKFR